MTFRTRAVAASGALLVALLWWVVPVVPAVGAGVTAVPRPDHVVVLVLENHSVSTILANPNAPYINSLATSGADMTQSFAETHPSQPNYVALFSGSTNGLTDDSCPHTFTGANLGSEALAAGIGFAGYSEGLPSVGYTGCTNGRYARKHNPWVNFSNVPAASNQPLTSFPTDYSTLPAISFVIPNLDHDMHDGTIAQGDTWVRDHLDGYVQWAKTHNSLLVLTFDEDDNTAANQIATVIVGQRVQPGRYAERINHYNVLRTIEDGFGLPALGGAAGATPILDIWTAVPNPPAGAIVASDTFGRTSSRGFGSADIGGAWTVAGSATNYTVTGGAGRIRMALAGSGPNAYLRSVSSTDTDLTTDISLDKLADSGSTRILLIGRATASGYYAGKLTVAPAGTVIAALTKTIAGADSTLSQATVSGLRYAAGTYLHVRLQVVGSAPTSLRFKVWKLTDPEPSAWLLTTTDSAASVQSAGGIGLLTYLSSAATNAPATLRVDNLSARHTR